MDKIITIENKDSSWTIIEKNEDMSCSIKHINSDDILEGEIMLISSSGKYTIGVKNGKDKFETKGK